MKLLYTGTAPGQAEEVIYSGAKYRRGEEYDVDEELGLRLLAKGGFYLMDRRINFYDEQELEFEFDQAAVEDDAAAEG